MADKMYVVNIIAATFKDDTVLASQQLAILRKIEFGEHRAQ